jgi:hypothetical protein
MIGMSCGPCCYAAQEIAGHHDICRGSAYALTGALPKWIDATGTHVAVAAAKAQLSKTTLRLLFIEPVPCSLIASSLANIEHLPAGGINGSIANILTHISTSIITSKFKLRRVFHVLFNDNLFYFKLF